MEPQNTMLAKKIKGENKIDVRQFGKVAVLYGGVSAEREVSLQSGRAVLQACLRCGVDAIGVDIGIEAAQQLSSLDFDRSFIALHGRGGEDGSMQGLLELLNIPYTGSGVMASAIGMDKWRTKLLWQASGMPTPKDCVLSIHTDWQKVMSDLGGLVMVKPAREGSSIGMRKVRNAQELQASYEFAAQHDALVIAEQYIIGREFTVSILSNQALPVIQLVTTHDFYDFNAKYESNDTKYLLPSELTEDEEQQVKKISLDAFHVVGCEGWGRVDIMQDDAGSFWLLEVNTSPGMTDHSLVPMAANAFGLTFDDLVLNILEQTL
jgi:D-alanine-D-alanine ligase